MELKGKIHKVSDTVQVTDSFRKREMVLELVDGQYSEYVGIEFVQDKVALLDTLSKGDSVDVSLNVRGRLYTDKAGVEKCFTTLQGWRISKSDGVEAVGVSSSSDGEDDLPF